MPWKVTPAKWLQVETDRVQEIILVPRFWRRAWTAQSLKAALGEIGLDYSLTDCQEINAELHKRGVVADVGP